MGKKRSKKQRELDTKQFAKVKDNAQTCLIFLQFSEAHAEKRTTGSKKLFQQKFGEIYNSFLNFLFFFNANIMSR